MASALAIPAHAQFFGDRYPFEQPSRRPQQPPPPSGGFFSFPYFEGSPIAPITRPRPAPPVESSKAPPPRKLETQPTSTVVVIGDSLADWLAYGLEEIYAESPETGVVRKIRPTSGLVRYEPRSDTPEWSQAVKDVLAAEKPSAIVVMLGLNDRLPLRERAPPRPGPQREGEQPAQASPQGQDKKPAQSASEPAQQADEQSAAASDAQHPAQGGTYEFRTDKWAELYSKRIDDMIAALKSKGVPVLWVGLPAIRGPRSTSDMNYLDDLYRACAEKAGIVYVDIWDGFVDEYGRYSVQGPDFEGQTRRLRTGDGVHFTKVGAVKLAHYVEHELSRVMSSHVVPVALPGPEEISPAKPGAARPAVGPVLPLTATGGGEAGDLLGGSSHPAPVTSDPIAARVLSRGDAIAAHAGRADDFSWPRPGTDANETPEVTPEPAALTTVPAKEGSAGGNDGKKPEGAKNDVKGKAPLDAPAVRGRHSSNEGLDGAPQKLPTGPAAAATDGR
ncbi:MAG: SGNH family hydrolase [Xanthobacteraceae bacterium]